MSAPSTNIPRGIKNNNPGNIRSGTTVWAGLASAQTDPDFCVFISPEMGLRAMMVLLLSYYHRHGLNTVRSICNRWAPPSENDTGAYGDNLANFLKVTQDTVLNLDDPLLVSRVAAGICMNENGRAPANYPNLWYDDATYARAAQMVFART